MLYCFCVGLAAIGSSFEWFRYLRMREDGYFGRYPRYTFFLISTPFFSPSLDVLIFWAFSASNVLKGVLNFISDKF